MSDMDQQQPDPVQPEGQGGEGTGGSPVYGEYLSRIPDEARPVAEEAFKAWDANYTRHQQEASQYRKQWEPYEQLGVHELSPDEVQWALQFRQAAVENPKAVKEWYEQQYAPQHQLTEQPQQPQTPPQDEFGFPDPSAQQLEQLLQQHLGPVQEQLQQITSWREQQETQMREEVASRAIEHRMNELAQQHPGFDRQLVERFATPYAQPGADPVKVVDQGWADYQAFAAKIEKQTLQAKVEAPSPPETGGAVNAATEQPSFASGDLGKLAAAQIRAHFQQ